MCFHLLGSFLISFSNILWFSVYTSFISLVKFISKYFILLDAIVSKTDFLTSPSKLQVCINTIDLLILYPKTLLNFNSSSFLIDYSGFSTYRILSSMNSDSFTSCFPTWLPLFFLSNCSSSSMSNSNGESRCPRLIPTSVFWVVLLLVTLCLSFSEFGGLDGIIM